MSLFFAPEDLERSPIHRVHVDAPLTYAGGKAFIAHYARDEVTTQSRCGLVDLANLHRVGFRGAQAAEYLAGRGFVLPSIPNTAVRQPSGEWIARLSQSEYFLMGALHDGGATLAQLEADWRLEQQACYCLPRQDSHTCLLLHGAQISEVMAKLCGVDLRTDSFAPGCVVQTSIARVSGIIVNSTVGETPCFHLLFDRASAHYLWHALLDAMQEFGGTATGINVLRKPVE